MTPIEPLDTMQREAMRQKEFSSIRSLALCCIHGHGLIRHGCNRNNDYHLLFQQRGECGQHFSNGCSSCEK